MRSLESKLENDSAWAEACGLTGYPNWVTRSAYEQVPAFSEAIEDPVRVPRGRAKLIRAVDSGRARESGDVLSVIPASSSSSELIRNHQRGLVLLSASEERLVPEERSAPEASPSRSRRELPGRPVPP